MAGLSHKKLYTNLSTNVNLVTPPFMAGVKQSKTTGLSPKVLCKKAIPENITYVLNWFIIRYIFNIFFP